MVNIVRSSRPEVLCKKGVVRNSAKFTGKDLCQSLYFNKTAGLRRDCYGRVFMSSYSMEVFL